MGSLGMPEILMILVIALIIFGPRKLPELGKSLGKSLASFRRASEDFKRQWEDEVEMERQRISPPDPAPVEYGNLSEPAAEAGEEAAASGEDAGSFAEAAAESGEARELDQTGAEPPLASQQLDESNAQETKRDWM